MVQFQMMRLFLKGHAFRQTDRPIDEMMKPANKITVKYLLETDHISKYQKRCTINLKLVR